jgi:putative endonuclease
LRGSVATVAISRLLRFARNEKNIMSKQYWVYIMTNKRNTVLYTGVTGNLPRRIEEHKNKNIKGFTQKYNVDKLIFAECFENINYALTTEKKIKGGSRQKKIDLVKSINPEFKELTF